MDKSYGLSILPGYQISDNATIYGRLGYQKGYFKYAKYKTNQGALSGLTEYEWLNGFNT